MEDAPRPDVPALSFRSADRRDLPELIRLLADDPLGATREDAGAPERYASAFDTISADPNHEIIVAVAEGGVVGMLQLSFLPHLTYRGGWRAQVEGVRVAEALRSRGVGRALLTHAIDRARERGCHMVQLTTDRRRPASAFYEALGFVASHDGMKLHLG